MATSGTLADFEDDDTCENGNKGCPNAPSVSETIDGDIDNLECAACFIQGEA